MTTRAFHAISGLPRSGSTLLSAILSQNPVIAAGISTPVLPLINQLRTAMSGGEMASQFDDASRRQTLRGLVMGYYENSRPIVFDTHRGWSTQISLLTRLFSNARVICCVRDVPDIINSLEAAISDNPLRLPSITQTEGKRSYTQYGRVASYMNLNHGIVGAAWAGLREAWFGPHASTLMVVRYESLVASPAETMSSIYDRLGIAPFEHDFGKLAFDHQAFDERIDLPGLHTVRSEVGKRHLFQHLLPDLKEKYEQYDFWQQEDAEGRGITLI